MRIADQVARPAHPQTPFVEHFLAHLRSRGLDFVPEPLGRDTQGRQRLSFLPGQAPTSPYPDWAWDHGLLVDVATHQQRMHEAAHDYRPPDDAIWAVSGGNYFPTGAAGILVCHNDLCMSNIIVDTERCAVSGIVDFDYTAPSNRLFDIAVLARHWAPFGDPDGGDLGDLDRVSRFRTIADIHQLDRLERGRVVDLATRFLVRARTNVKALADAGNAGFRQMIADGYDATNRATVDWLSANRTGLIGRWASRF